MSHPPLTLQQVRAIAHLARLELSDDELATMTRTLDAIVEYVAQLQEVATEVEPLAHALPVNNVFRHDEPRPSLSPSDSLACAPDRRTVRGEQFYAVPAVLESDPRGSDSTDCL
jgi:aspartyl-tRNA(Asn)/glutamyl-tRNA(Gln) amidotransferase subunit C